MKQACRSIPSLIVWALLSRRMTDERYKYIYFVSPSFFFFFSIAKFEFDTMFIHFFVNSLDFFFQPPHGTNQIMLLFWIKVFFWRESVFPSSVCVFVSTETPSVKYFFRFVTHLKSEITAENDQNSASISPIFHYNNSLCRYRWQHFHFPRFLSSGIFFFPYRLSLWSTKTFPSDLYNFFFRWSNELCVYFFILSRQNKNNVVLNYAIYYVKWPIERVSEFVGYIFSLLLARHDPSSWRDIFEWAYYSIDSKGGRFFPTLVFRQGISSSLICNRGVQAAEN